MKEISDIYLGRMNNGAHFTYVSNLLARAEGDRAVSTKAAAQVAALKAAVEQEDADLKLSRKSMLSDEIAAADAKRDDLYVGYKKAVQGLPQFGITECLIQHKCSVHTPPSHAIRSG